VNGVSVDDGKPFRSAGEKGVFLAHLNILQSAAASGESVLILEDDVDFTPAASAWARNPESDIDYGGYSAANPADLEGSDIIGAHCMGFSARAAKALVPFLEQLLNHPSPPPIDGAYVWFRRQNPEFVTEFAQPVLAVQRPSRSDITPARMLDRISILRRPVALARRVKRKLQRGEITFGLPEAIAICVIGIAVASFAAYRNLH
jgi:glycosyl transferase family 25